MNTYAMYVGSKETKVRKCSVYLVGYVETPKSHIIRCKQTDFIYSSKEALDRDWKFFAPTKEPYDFSFVNS